MSRPVLVGVGTSTADADAPDLMVLAARAAGDDCGAPALLERVQRVTVPRGTWPDADPGRFVAREIGAPKAESWLIDLGIPQQTLINQALQAISDGDLDVALVVGAEAKARAAREAKKSSAANEAGLRDVFQRAGGDDSSQPDVHQVPQSEIVAQAEVEARLFAPVEQYALIESALRASTGLSVDDHRAEVAGLYARMNGVAATNPEAAFPAPMSASDLFELGPSNRPLAFPYGKWHASQWTVDQAAALLFCSTDVAEELGVPRDRWIFPLVGLESSLAVSVTKRKAIHRWPAMQVLGGAAASRVGRALSECDHAEVYSCFPVAVRVQQRELGLPTDGTPTITGGMSFGGGPFNSFVLQATAAMARRLRSSPGTGLVTTVSGLLTKPGLAVWSTADDGQPPLVADLKEEAMAATEMVDVLSSFDGEATMAALTVTYDGFEPKELIGILDTPSGDRVIAKSSDPSLLARATSEELIGQTFTVAGNALA